MITIRSHKYKKLSGLSATRKPISKSKFLLSLSVIIVLSIGMIYLFHKINMLSKLLLNEKVFSESDYRELLLHDSTMVFMNLNSTIQFSSTSRIVNMTGGCYFNTRIKPDSFVVYLGEVQIKCNGAEFCLVKNDPFIYCYSIMGEIVIKITGKKVKMVTGQMIRYDVKNPEINYLFNDELNIFSWKTKNFYFNTIPLKKALEIIARSYGKDLEMKSEIDKTISKSYKNIPLNEILKDIEKDFNIRIDNIYKYIIVEQNK